MGMGDNALPRDCIAMPAMTIPGTMPTTPKEKKLKNSKSPSAKKRRSLNSILGENRTLKAWLRPGKGSPTEAFVILADGLSPKDREFIASTADLVVDPGEDLIGLIARLKRENRQLKSLSLSDDLTGLYNKRFFSIQLEIEMARARRTGLPCSLTIIDFDNFKEINDRLGHDEGDRFLIQMGGLIREKLRPTDFVCRYGGDEFAVIMPATSLLDAIGIAKRLREFTAHFTWKMAVQVSASIGLAAFEPSNPMDAEEFFKRADNELYRAKKAGKNRISYPAQASTQARQRDAVARNEREALFSLETGA
jgi:diguanylate cyclase (GGDEF)-like protein